MNYFVKSIISLAVLSFSSWNAQAQCVMNEQGYVDIAGYYVCTGYCQVYGGATYVTQNADKIVLINEKSQTATGEIDHLGGNSTDWGVTFEITNNCKQIVFSNSTIWLKNK
ncbi:MULTISPECIES: hypothetical protein [unclassified Agarivorans]|uniref:hypothetical protein n=1 Tax=unclassified Agarivorans TaxID=2636026 RepID=UPI003D7E9E5A